MKVGAEERAEKGFLLPGRWVSASDSVLRVGILAKGGRALEEEHREAAGGASGLNAYPAKESSHPSPAGQCRQC